MSMSDAHDTTAAGPYAAAAHAYLRAGWAPLPLPARKKGPVPTGWTGNDGAWPSFADVHAWTEDHAGGNIALRLPPGVIGIDVDHYGSKPGGLVLADLEQRLGALPATWRTTSRDDGISGIRLYRVPEGLRWPGVLGPGIETIRTGHRYVVTWPSIHPDTGGTYRWITPDGPTALTDIPNPDELPWLPDGWVQHFTKGEIASDQPRAGLSAEQAGAWVVGRDPGLRPPCRHMHTAAQSALVDLTAGTSRHEAALAGTNRIVWLVGEGHVGGATALTELHSAFLRATAGDRVPGDAEAEWARMVDGAVQLAAAAHPNPNPDPCDDPFAGLIPKENPWTSTQSSSNPTTPPAKSAPTTSTASTPATSASAAVSSTTSTVTSPAPDATDADTSTADDLTETQIRRNQAAAQEVERIRAQRAAMRLLDLEDEEHAIADRVRRKLFDDKAAVEYKRQTEPPAPPFDAGTLADILARPADPPMRVEGLIPWSGSALVVAQRKTGKTTLLLNYARALITGEPFLGEFDVIALPIDARVAFLNYEVSAAQLARWATDAGIPDDRLFLVNLRGRRNPLGHPDDRAALAATLRAQNVHAVIVDPFGRAYTGQSQNDNGEVQAFLVGLEEFARTEVGALDLMLATHAGWDGERTRGASALEDWGDVIITMTRDPEEEERRFMKAMGRDVDVPEDELVMDHDRTLRRTGNGSRKQSRESKKTADLAVLVVRAARMEPGLSYRRAEELIKAMDEGVKFRNGDVSKAAKFASTQGHLVIGNGPRGGASMTAKEPTSPSYPSYPDLSPGELSTSPTSPIGERWRWSGEGDVSSPRSDLSPRGVDKRTGEVIA